MMKATVISVVLASAAVIVADAQTHAPAFTEGQAEAGHAAYAKHCASCHMPDLTGNNEVPALAGPAFMGTWGNRTTKDLRDYMSAAMPYGGPSLDADTYTVIAAYVLQVNGAVSGEEKLTTSTAVPIGSLVPKPRAH